MRTATARPFVGTFDPHEHLSGAGHWMCRGLSAPLPSCRAGSNLDLKGEPGA